MQNNQFALLKNRRFLPLFVTQFLGAFHDNLFKNAFVVLLLYGAATNAEHDPKILTSIASGVFILPFILFSAVGGQMADRIAKDKVIRVIKLIEIGIAALGAVSLLSGSVTLCFITLFALGTHSAFFGPSKYSILPQHLKDDELIGGNAVLNTGTFLAILTGTVAGTSLMGLSAGTSIVSALLFVCAITGWLSSRSIPPAPPKAHDKPASLNPVRETLDVMRYTLTLPDGVTRAVFGVAWFYFMGGMFVAQMPNFVHDTLHADQQVLSLLLATFSIGMAIGGLLNNRLLRGRIEAVYVPLAVLGISAFAMDLCFATKGIVDNGTTIGALEFLSQIHNWRIVFDIVMISLCGGLFVVPLDAIVQHRTKEDHRARVQAGNAVLSSLFIAASSMLCAWMIGIGIDVRTMFMLFAAANACVALLTCALLPDYLFKSMLQGLFRVIYKVEVRGLENISKAGPRAVIVANHVSLLDPPLLAAFLPGKPMFAVNSYVAEWWWVKPFLKLIDAFPLDPGNPYSMKTLIRKVEEDRQVVIFPEGRLTETGSLMKVYEGPGMIADKADAAIVPVRLDGVQYTGFARLKGKVPRKRFPKIVITILEPRKFQVDEALKGRERRSAAGRQLHDVMETMMFETGDRHQTLFSALLKARSVQGSKALIAEDVERKPMRFGRLITASLALARPLSGMTKKGEAVGLLMPNALGTLATFFALQSCGRVTAMLNFSAGAQALASACRTAQVNTIVTSRRFITIGRLDDVIAALSAQAKVVYLEDIRKDITTFDRLRALFTSPGGFHNGFRIDPNDPAVILFTSGSEGEPKGVVLSHANLMANIQQLSSRIDFNRQDIVFNCLPMFHAFGLTGGTLLPVLSGVRTFLYPSPLHYRIVPEMVYSSNATIMFGTDTFLQGYARMANTYDFYRMRYIFAGAEKVKDETRRLYMERFSTQILEGYGATEAGPVIAVNSAMHRKAGTVGRFLPGLEYRIEKVEGITEGERLFVRGPNVMLGYYMPDRPGVLKPLAEGWHDTGDIVAIDDNGFVTIKGRAKRFAKIAGEMVSLGQVEALAQSVWPVARHAAVVVPDARKGEQIVLITTEEAAQKSMLSEYASRNGIPALNVPGTVIYIKDMPILGSGKVDYGRVKDMAIKDVRVSI